MCTNGPGTDRVKISIIGKANNRAASAAELALLRTAPKPAVGLIL